MSVPDTRILELAFQILAVGSLKSLSRFFITAEVMVIFLSRRPGLRNRLQPNSYSYCGEKPVLAERVPTFGALLSTKKDPGSVPYSTF